MDVIVRKPKSPLVALKRQINQNKNVKIYEEANFFFMVLELSKSPLAFLQTTRKFLEISFSRHGMYEVKPEGINWKYLNLYNAFAELFRIGSGLLWLMRKNEFLS